MRNGLYGACLTFLKNTHGIRTHSEERTGNGDRCHGQTFYVTETILKSSSLPRSCLSLASGNVRLGARTFRVSVSPFAFILADSPSASGFSSAPNGRTERRTIPRTFVERQKERGSCQASSKSRWKNQETKR